MRLNKQSFQIICAAGNGTFIELSERDKRQTALSIVQESNILYIDTFAILIVIFQGIYTLRGYDFDKNAVPQIFHPGQYKVEFTVYKKGSDEINSKGGVIFKLY